MEKKSDQHNDGGGTERSVGCASLLDAFKQDRPVVAILGQTAGWFTEADPVLAVALEHVGIEGRTWRDLLRPEILPTGFYEWLAGRFERRLPSAALEELTDAHFSAVFTSSLDPGLANMLSTGGREAEPVILGSPPPRVVRSRRRPPLYHLFGRAGGGSTSLRPPQSAGGMAQHRLRHTSAMLAAIAETVTPMGLVVVDGYDPADDWLRAEDLLAAIGSSPAGGVLWCGKEPGFADSEAETFAELVQAGIVVKEPRPLATLLAEVKAELDPDAGATWGDPEIVSLDDGRRLVVEPSLRLVTQTSSSIIDDSWTASLAPLDEDEERASFHVFHGLLGSPRTSVEGVRRGFSIEREFERGLWRKVQRALAHHQSEQGATIVHGQSGTGKSVALSRLVLKARETGVPVLLATGRLPQPVDIAPFLQAVDKVERTTLLVADATLPPDRYDEILRSARSLGHRLVVVGSSYRIGAPANIGAERAFEASDRLSLKEGEALLRLVERFATNVVNSVRDKLDQTHTLARFYRLLPESRARIARGLGREALFTEQELRLRGARSRRTRPPITAMAQALALAGFAEPGAPLFDEQTADPADGPAARVIDLVMSASRLFKNVPIGLLLRTVSNELMLPEGRIDTELLTDMFEGQDLFRWKFGDEEGSDLMVGARLQIEAQIICERRIGGARGEADALLDLVRNAHRAGPEDADETRFVAEIVQAMGPDGPEGDRFRDHYAEIARALTSLRASTGVLNGRLMLQESSLRRAYVRTHQDIESDERARLLVEATEAVDLAVDTIESDPQRIYASRRTKQHLIVDRAATYGFLATGQAKEGSATSWSAYVAARDRLSEALSQVETYHSQDIALWLPTRVLAGNSQLDDRQRFELRGDLLSGIDSVDVSSLDPAQADKFHQQRMIAAGVLGDEKLADEAFQALAEAGSTVGYYLRAREMAPKRLEGETTLGSSDVDRASRTADYLVTHRSTIAGDSRCLRLLLEMEWAKATGRWLFRGLRQPIPAGLDGRTRVRSVLSDLILSQPHDPPARHSYLDAVMTWLEGSEEAAIRKWRDLDQQTRYVEAGRVVARHVITDESQRTIVYSGTVDRHIGGDRWSVYVEKLRRHVDMLASSFPNENLAKGRSVANFAVAFNYRGPIADRIPTGIER